MIVFQNPGPEEFKEWPKIPRLNRDVVLSEKIDGTNSCVWISDDGSAIGAQSRTRWITPHSDNFGFAAWVEQNREELSKLGPGTHYGEWYGRGIQRSYGLQDRRFSLFNTHRWNPDITPAGVGVVPILWQGNFKDLDLAAVMAKLKEGGSLAVPGYMRPEGIVIFHTAFGGMQKILCEGDELPKGINMFKERQVAAELQGQDAGRA